MCDHDGLLQPILNSVCSVLKCCNFETLSVFTGVWPSVRSVTRSVRSGCTHISGTFSYIDNVWLLPVLYIFQTKKNVPLISGLII